MDPRNHHHHRHPQRGPATLKQGNHNVQLASRPTRTFSGSPAAEQQQGQATAAVSLSVQQQQQQQQQQRCGLWLLILTQTHPATGLHLSRSAGGLPYRYYCTFAFG